MLYSFIERSLNFITSLFMIPRTIQFQVINNGRMNNLQKEEGENYILLSKGEPYKSQVFPLE